MRSSSKFTLAVLTAPAVLCLLSADASAASRDPLVIPGIGPHSWRAERRAAAHHAHRAPPARAVYPPRPYAFPVAHHAPRRAASPYWIAEAPPRRVRIASLAPLEFQGPAWEAPHPYDDEYRPAAYNGADAFPPPARPFLRPLPPRRFGFW
jgi:hypothetical protein